jgi:hypothetical protein
MPRKGSSANLRGEPPTIYPVKKVAKGERHVLEGSTGLMA